VRLRTALLRGLPVRITGLRAGRVQVRVLHGRTVVGRRTATAGRSGTATATVRFTAKARRTLARRRSVRLTVVAGAVRGTVLLRR
jgi:hypothetical protein